MLEHYFKQLNHDLKKTGDCDPATYCRCGCVKTKYPTCTTAFVTCTTFKSTFGSEIISKPRIT